MNEITPHLACQRTNDLAWSSENQEH